MYQLYPNEQLELEVESIPHLKAGRRSRYLLWLGFILVAVALFYSYASKQDFILNIITIGSIIGAIICFVAYFIAIANGKKNEKFTYYITDRRVIQIDQDNKLVKEVLRNKIKRVLVEPVTANKGSVIINPRKLDAQTKYKNELKGNTTQKYTKDTFIIEDVSKLAEIENIIKL
ncbi:MAG: hypothetical protein GX074_03205 [Erysipelothrix sp.]|nr:hypothetical protein [Erysipelothrix sp.]